MTGLLIVSVILGGLAASLSGLSFLFWVVAVVFFVCGLPFALLASFVHGEVSYAQDREDYRQAMSDIVAQERADEHEYAEDERLDRLARSVRNTSAASVNVDARQIHLHGG
jgi:hypothetical protein